MSSDDGLIEGTVKGLLYWTTEQISEIVYKLNNKSLLFINNKETIGLIKNQRKTPEWDIYNRYLKLKKGDDLRVIILMGLALRGLEFKGELDKVRELREKIKSKYDINGLHIAQFIQNDFLGKYFGDIISKTKSIIELKKNIEEILNNLDKYVIFIKDGSSPKKLAEKIKIRIFANLPKTFIISSTGSAIAIAKKIESILEGQIDDYLFGSYKEKGKYICFLNKIEEEN